MIKLVLTLLVVFMLIFILYKNGIIPITVKSSVMFIGGAGGKKASFTSCHGYLKRMIKLESGRSYFFFLKTRLTNGRMTVQLLDRDKQPLFTLDEFSSSQNISVSRTGRYLLMIRFDSATGEYELDWR